MKAKTIVPLVLGVVVGGAAIKIVVDVVNNAQAATRTDLAQCVVAKVDIDYAEEITPEKLVLKEWPKSSLPAQYFDSLEAVNTRVSGMYIAKDVPVYPSMLAPEGTPPGIQVRIKKGYRAVAVAIDEVTGVSYQVAPSDRVDVVALVKHRQDGQTKQMSRIILQNIEVASVGRQLHTDKRGETKSVARSVTLLLRPEEVAELHLAQSLGGRISLALRGNQEDDGDGEGEATQDSLVGTTPEATPAPTPRPLTAAVDRDPSPQWSVKVISGNSTQDVNYHWQGNRWEPGDSSRPRSVPIPQVPMRTQPENDNDEDFDSARDEDSAEES